MENQTIFIRKANESDMLTVYEQICKLEEITFEINPFQSIFNCNIQDKNVLYYLAETQSGQCLGFISIHIQLLLHHCGKVAEIQELYVEDGHRSKGIGLQLVNHAQQVLKELNCVSFEVTAQNKRIQTHAFYEKAGFRKSHLKFIKEII